MASTVPLGGIRRQWNPGEELVVEGSFVVSGGAILSTAANPLRPHTCSGWTATYKAAGVWVIQLDYQSAASVLRSTVQVGPSVNASGALPTALPVNVMISQDFITTNAGGTAYAADTTNSQLVILASTGGSLTDPSSSYRVSFEIVVSMNPISS